MHGLRTSSVLILDDNHDDALEIQRSLALHGIGAILVLGGQEMEKPSERATGIRVAVLDIYLGATTNAAEEIRQTTRVVDELISEENGAYVAVVWTANPSDYEEFEKQLRKIRCPPVRAVKLDKNKVLQNDVSRSDKAQMILDAIGEAIGEVPALRFSSLWEQLVHDAANDTLLALGIGTPSQASDSRGMATLSALLRSEAGGALSDDRNAARALLAALNPVHFDRVENRSTRIADHLEKAAEPIRRVAKGSTTPLLPDERARLNTAMIFDQQADGLSAGHIYSFTDIEGLGIGPALPESMAIRSSIVEERHLRGEDNLPAIPPEDLPVLFLEINATCDHRQQKISATRLIGGVAISAGRVEGAPNAKPVVRRGERLRKLQPLNLPGWESFPGGRVVLVWDALYPVSVSSTSISQLRPIGRLREPVLSDIRSRMAFHVSRSGYASV